MKYVLHSSSVHCTELFRFDVPYVLSLPYICFTSKYACALKLEEKKVLRMSLAYGPVCCNIIREKKVNFIVPHILCLVVYLVSIPLQ